MENGEASTQVPEGLNVAPTKIDLPGLLKTLETAREQLRKASITSDYEIAKDLLERTPSVIALLLKIRGAIANINPANEMYSVPEAKAYHSIVRLLIESFRYITVQMERAFEHDLAAGVMWREGVCSTFSKLYGWGGESLPFSCPQTAPEHYVYMRVTAVIVDGKLEMYHSRGTIPGHHRSIYRIPTQLFSKIIWADAKLAELEEGQKILLRGMVSHLICDREDMPKKWETVAKKMEKE